MRENIETVLGRMARRDREANDSLEEKLKNNPYRAKSPEELEATKLAIRRAQGLLCDPACPICEGSGYYRLEIDDIHDPRFGKLQMCPNIDIAKMPGSSRYGLETEELSALSWSSVMAFDDSRSLYAMEKVRAVLERGWGLIYLYGDHGQAKSLILKIAVAEYLRKNRQAAYANMIDILDFVRMAYDENNPNQESQIRLEWYAMLPLLAIDEFDRTEKNPWTSTRTFKLFDDRVEAALLRKKITLLASNLRPEKLDSYYSSRVRDGRFECIPLFGPDARPGMELEDSF